MQVKCTECGDIIERPGPTEAIGELDVSHGVCERCEAVYTARLEAELEVIRQFPDSPLTQSTLRTMASAIEHIAALEAALRSGE